MRNFISLLFFSMLIFSGCKYSFKGISIPPDVKNFYVNPFDISAANVEPTLSQTFTERLKDKVLTESRLSFVTTEPDCEFKGNITRYSISSVAPQPGETTAFNRLDIGVKVEFINHMDETQDWQNTFTYFANFPTDQSFLDLQESLIADINDQLVEDIFNKAFTNW